MGEKYWYQKQLRMLQTVLRESDMVGYDAKQVVEYLEKTNSNSIIINAGGIIDFFPIEEPLGRKNVFMGDRDILKELVEECHAHDISVMVRVDFRGVEAERYEERPDWFAQDKNGKAKAGWGGRIHKPCYNGIYANDHAIQYIKNMMSRYPVDGIWENSVGFGDGPCYCKVCRDKYREDTGKEIPTGDDYASEEFREYRVWKASCAREHLRRMRDAVKSFGEDKAYCAEIFGMFHASNALMTGIDLYDAKDMFDFLVSPAFLDGSAQPDRKYDDLTYAASSMRFLKAIDPGKQAVLLYGNNGTKWRYVMAPKQETKIWLWEAASVGAGYWNCMFNGQHPAATHDKRNAGLETEAYTYLKEHEDILDGLVPWMDAGIYYSKPSRDRFGNDKEELDEYGVFIKGVERAFTRNHVQYQFIPDLEFSYEKIRQLKMLVLPNAACISGEHMDIIREYVKNGGGLIASDRTSLYDEAGRQRADFGLRDMFGCSYTGIEKDTSLDCYQKIRNQHEILNQCEPERTEVLMNEGRTLLCTECGSEGMTAVCTYIPMIFNQPPEFAWRANLDTEYPTVMAGEYGSGRVVYFANQTDKLCYTNGHEDFLNLYMGACNWVMSGDAVIETDAPESVHVVLTKKVSSPEELVLSVVNITSGTARPVREVLPVFHMKIRISLDAKSVVKWKTLRQEGKVSISSEREGGKLVISVELEKLQEFTSVYIKTN